MNLHKIPYSSDHWQEENFNYLKKCFHLQYKMAALEIK